VSQRNQLLAAMEAASRKRMEPHLQPVHLKLKTVVCEAGAVVKHAYFPLGCVLSLLTVLDDGTAIETANIGREGAFGIIPGIYRRASFNQCLVQLDGPMLRCPIAVLQGEFERSAQVRDLLVSYSETLMSQVQQTVGCNALHSVEQRMCRWLLMMFDRADGERMAYTHEFLSHIMGVNRTSISLAAKSLQRAGLITYRRGKMQVIDKGGLEDAACECYGVVKSRFDAFLGPAVTAARRRSSSLGRHA
jgi:CRP-like cAMP-binding protein